MESLKATNQYNELVEDSKLIYDSLGKLNKCFFGKKILITGAAGFLGSQFAFTLNI
jgi:FlaA1/EpsC-like NDP-sugar epimerase